MYIMFKLPQHVDLLIFMDFLTSGAKPGVLQIVYIGCIGSKYPKHTIEHVIINNNTFLFTKKAIDIFKTSEERKIWSADFVA